MKRAPRSFGGGAFGSVSAASSLSYLAEPPSLGDISDPNVVVSLKNVFKKDSITRAKGLEDLLQHARARPFDQAGATDEALLDVWTRIYPRLSIDSSRRVRELSHTVHLELLRSARKRMERRIPDVVGAWLGGLYDRDRSVARAAADGVSSFLSTPEKVTAFWTKCQAQILYYATEAMRETQDTLSDERTTTPEDAEAKYFRVIAASLSLVLGLLRLPEGSIQRSVERLDGYFETHDVWKAITFNDSQVRKAVCQMLFVCLERGLPYADTAQARRAFVTGGLKTSQAGSALEYTRALTKLTQRDPCIWHGNSREKKTPLMRLQAFIAKGSQGSPPTYWDALSGLFSSLPVEVLTLEASSGLLLSVSSGIASRDEPRTHSPSSWKCYVCATRCCLRALPYDDQLALAREHHFPLLERSILFPPSSTPLGPDAICAVVDIHISLLNTSSLLSDACATEWERLGVVLCSSISASLPSVSRDYQRSQTGVAEDGRRWFSLVGLLHDQLNGQLNETVATVDPTTGPSVKVITQCITILEGGDLKPFGASQILEHALSKAPHLFTGEAGQQLANFLQASAEGDIDKLVRSPSYQYLFSCLHIFGGIPGRQDSYGTAWTSCLSAALALAEPTQRNAALTHLVSQVEAASMARDHSSLQEVIFSQAQAAMGAIGDSEESAMALFQAAMTNKAVNAMTGQRTASDAMALLATKTEKSESALRVLEVVAKNFPEIFTDNVALRIDLVAQLLSLTELGDDTVALMAGTVRSLLDGQGHETVPVTEIIQSNLERAGPQSLEISTLISQAKVALSNNVSWDEILPSTNAWMAALTPLLERPLNPTLSISSRIGGAVSLADTVSSFEPRRAALSRDRKGRCVPARMALYTCELLTSVIREAALPRQFHIELLFLQSLSARLAFDQIMTMDNDGLWANFSEDAGVVVEAEELIAASANMLDDVLTTAVGWSEAQDDSISGVVNGLVELAMKQTAATWPAGVHSARVLSELLQQLTEAHGVPTNLDDRFLTADTLKAKPEVAFTATGLLTGFGESIRASKAVGNFCNRLVSDLAGASSSGDRTLMALVLFSHCAQLYEVGELPVSGTRIVFAAKQITSWTDDLDSLDPRLCAEMCRALTRLLPCMKDVYGSYWEKTLQFCVDLWERAGRFVLLDALSFIHSTLKLYKALEDVEEANDDLQDALRDFATAKSNGLIELLRLPRDEGSRSHVLEMVDAMLCRETDRIPLARIPDPVSLFPLMASESWDIQTAAFGLMHRKIPEQQEKQAVESMLAKTDARLPDEMLSLLLDPPTLEKFSDEALASFPSSVRCYLLTWRLLFDAFSVPSPKIRSDYTEHLKTGDYANALLEFLFDVLGHSAAHPLNLDKEGLGPQQICEYDIKLAEAEPRERNMHWLLTHLYYLTLRHLPGLFKSWYMGCKQKQTRVAVESWTAKYLSPLIISDALNDVQAWADSQEAPAGDEQQLQVKVAKPAREVTASYEVDESQASIAIRVPPGYPMDGVTVTGVHRVAVSERKWQSWIMTTQGVIAFSNGSLVDGLQVFKRNMVGALRGQSECAICYSIISTDKRTPDKRCATCKNMFHRACLYKWFQTSNQNKCPLCRNPIDFLGADAAKRRQW